MQISLRFQIQIQIQVQIPSNGIYIQSVLLKSDTT